MNDYEFYLIAKSGFHFFRFGAFFILLNFVLLNFYFISPEFFIFISSIFIFSFYCFFGI